MSIIHDAFKKVQQGMSSFAPKDKQTVTPPPEKNTSGYIYETAPIVENVVTDEPKAPIKDSIKTILIISGVFIVLLASILYLWNASKSARYFAKNSFNRLMHKQHAPDFRNRPAESLKPLAQLTVSEKASPVTLDIHGIMANAAGNLVLINDQVYQEGDKVDGAQIVKIDLDSIKIINNGIEQTIFVKN